MTISIQTILQNNLPLGYTGSIGYTGSSGAGFTGSASSGYTGSAGLPGQFAGLGYSGSRGFAGFTGSASGYTGSIGYTGSPGLPGLFAGMGYTGSIGAGYAGSTGGFNSLQLINVQTGTSYSLVLADAGAVVELYNLAPITVTIPSDSALGISVGQRVDIVQASLGSVFFTGGPGVSINVSGGVNYLNQYWSAASLLKTAANEWLLITPSPTGFTGSSGVGFVGSAGAGYAGSVGGFNSVQPINIQTGTSYQIQSSDAGNLIEFFNQSPITLTIPADSALPFLTGQRIDVIQRGNGAVFFVGGPGVTLITPDVNYLNIPNVAASLIKTGSYEWTLITPSTVGYTGSAGAGFIGSAGSLGYSGSGGSFASAQPIINVTGTSYTFQLSDAGDLVQFLNSAPTTVTIAPDSSILFPVGTRIDVVQRSSGSVFFVGGSGVTVNTPDVNYINVQNISGSVIKTGPNEWLFTGPSPSGYVGSSGAGFAGSIGSAGYVGSTGGFASAQELSVVTGTNYTLQLSDSGDLVQFINAGTTNVTIPNDSQTYFPIGTRIDLVQRSTGPVFFVGASGVNLFTPDFNYLNAQNISGTLIKTAVNEWLFTGPSSSGYTGSIGSVGYAGSLGTAGYSGSIGGFNSIQTVSIQTGTSYTIQSTDAGSILEFFNTQTNTVNIPADSFLNFSVGQRIDIIQRSIGPVFFVGGPGVTLITPDVNYLNVPNVGATLVKTSANEWTLITPAPSGYTGSSGSGYIGSAGLGYAGSTGGFASAQDIALVTATSYTFQLADAGDLVQFFNNTPTVVTVANDSQVFFPTGTRIDVAQRSTGQVFFVGGSGVTVNTPDVNYLNSTNISGSLIKTAANEWLFTGPSPTGYTGSIGGSGFVGSSGSLGYAGSLGGFASAQDIGIVTATSYTFQLTDAGDLVQFFNTATTTVTIPNDNDAYFAIGTRIEMVQRNTGPIFFVGASGVAVNTPDVNYLNSRNISASIIKTGVNEWLFTGPSPSGYTGSSAIGFVGSSGPGYAGSAGGFDSAQILASVTATSYTFKLSDAGDLIQFFGTSTTIVTVDTDANVYFPIGTRIDVVQRSTGQIFFVGASGVTVITPDVNYLAVTNISGSLIKTNVNEWLFTGPSPTGYAGSTGVGYVGSIGTIGFVGSVGSFASLQFISVQTGTSYTIQTADAGSVLEFFNSATTTVTIPPESQLPFSVGQRIDILQRSIGAVFFIGGSGVTLNSPDVNYINGINLGATLIKVASNEWSLITPSALGYTGSTGVGFVGSSASGYAGSVGGFASAQSFTIITGTSYTIQSTDAGVALEFFSSATTTVTIPSDVIYSFAIGQRIDVIQRGFGSVFITPGGGVALNYADINFLNQLNSAGTIIKTAANEWLWTGPGAAGYSGSVGYVGSVGFIGSQGPKGDPGGYTGSAGSFGYVGSQGAGYTGSQSYTGSVGFVGSGGLGYTGSVGGGYTGSSGAFAALGYSGSAGSFASAQDISIVTGTNYTFQLADAGDLVQFFNTGTTTVTIAPDSSIFFPVGTRIDIVQRNIGPIFVVGGAGVLVNTPDTNYLNATNISASVIKTGANEWLFTGPSPAGYTGSGAGYTGSVGTSGYAGSLGGYNSLQPIVIITATVYTIQSGDAGNLVQFFNSATTTVTIPPDSSLSFSIGQRIDVVQRSTGAVFFTGGLGVNVITPDVNYLSVTNVAGTLMKMAANEWLFTGPSPTGYTGSQGATGFVGSVGSLGYVGSVGSFASIQAINIQTGTSYTIQSADAGSIIEFFNSATSTVTIPPDSSLSFYTGQRIDIIQRNIGPVFFTGGSGVTLITPDANYLNVPNTGASLVKTANNEWTLITPSSSGYTGSSGAGFTGSASAGYAGSAGSFASAQDIALVTATSYTFQLADAGDLVQFFNSSTTIVTVAPDSQIFFPTGTRIDLVQRSIGSVFFVGGSGVTVNTPDVNYLNATNISASIVKTAANEWLFTGPSPTGYTGSIGTSGFVGSIGTSGYSGSTGGFNSLQTINIQTGTSYTVQTTDAGSLLEFFNSATTTVTIPPESSLPFSIGQRIDIIQRSIGAVFFVGGVGVTVITPDVNYLNVPNVGASLIKTASNEWTLITPSPTGYTGSAGIGFAGSIGTSGFSGSAGGFTSVQAINIQTGTNYTVQTSDAGSILEFFNSGTNTVTIPPDSSLYFQVGQRIDVINRNIGSIFFVGGSGVTVITPDVNYLNVLNVAASLVKTAINEWTLITPSPTGYTGSIGSGFVGSVGLGYSGSAGSFASAQVLNIQTGTSYSIQTSDAGSIIEFFNTATTTVTIPPDTSLPFAIGQRIDVIQRSIGSVFFVGGAGVTVNTPDVNYLNSPNVGASLVKTAAYEWALITPSPTGFTGSVGIGYAGSTGFAGYSGSIGGFASAQQIVSVTATSYTFQLTDAGDLVQFFNPSAVTVTIANDAAVFFPIGTRIDVVQRNSGPVFFVGGSGVTVNTPDVNYINIPNVSGSIIKTAANEWLFTAPSPTGYTGSLGAGYSGSIGSSGYSGSVGGFNSLQPVNIQTGTSYSLLYTDAGSIIEFFNSATSTVTIPPDGVLPFLTGQRVDILQRGSGPVFFVGGPGVTVNSPDVNFTNAPNAAASLVKTSVNEWALITPSSQGYTGSSSGGFTGSQGGGYSGSAGSFASAQPIISVTATTYTFRLTDSGDLVQFFNSATTLVTVPGDSITNFAIGTRIDVIQRGSGAVFFVGGSGVTLNYSDINFLSAPSSAGTIIKTAANEWVWTGPGPAGYTGSLGAAGPTGPQGPAGGYTGSVGAGYGGSQGDVGSLGYTGSIGFGYIGSFGYTGSVGFVGSGGVGYTGSYGYTGFQGSTGAIGFSGSSGYTGSQSYTGSFGYSGSQGYTGSQGIGFTGSQSYTGSFGYSGSLGFSGSFGYTGSFGVGYTGSKGDKGDQGVQGPAGGFTGSQGVLGFAGSVGQGTAGVTRTYFYEGVLKENYSNKRFYIAVASQLYITRVNLNTAGSTQSTININVNGATINTVVIPAGVTYIQNTGTYMLYGNDYITVDITQASSANNLYVTFVYREVL